jgi:hypothetical protein
MPLEPDAASFGPEANEMQIKRLEDSFCAVEEMRRTASKDRDDEEGSRNKTKGRKCNSRVETMEEEKKFKSRATVMPVDDDRTLISG